MVLLHRTSRAPPTLPDTLLEVLLEYSQHLVPSTDSLEVSPVFLLGQDCCLLISASPIGAAAQCQTPISYLKTCSEVE